MGKNEARNYRGIRIEPCDGLESGRWRLMMREISSGEWVGRCNRPQRSCHQKRAE